MPLTITHPWGTFKAWPDIVGHALETGVVWDQQIQATLERSDPAGWAIDLGANIGFWTIWLARRHPHVIAVEAHPSTYQLLLDNLHANGVMDRVEPYQCAAYDRPTEMALAPPEWVGWPIPDELNLDTCTYGSSVAFLPAAQVQKPALVQARPIDDLIPADVHVSVIKCDVQGCDLRALMGLERTITRCRPIICYEVETGASVWHGDDLAAHEAWFKKLGYRVEVIQVGLWDFAAIPEERV